MVDYLQIKSTENTNRFNRFILPAPYIKASSVGMMGGGYTRRWGTSIFYLHKMIISYTAVRCYKNLVFYPHFKASGYFIATVELTKLDLGNSSLGTSGYFITTADNSLQQ